MPTGKYLGIDYGTKRIGLAISDDRGRLAFPKTIVKNDGQALVLLSGLVESEGISAIVVGESLNYKGKPNAVSKDIENFITDLKALGLPIEKEKEFFTSVEARKLRPGTKADANAAALILQRYLDRINLV